MWRHLCLTVLQAEYQTDRSCELPEYLGSTLRGAFGQELRAVSCVEGRSPCEVCRRADLCPAGALFDDQAMSLPLDGGRRGESPLIRPYEPASPPKGEGPSLGFDRPRPYVLVPPPRRRGSYTAGESIRFGVTLIGRGRVWSSSVVAAIAGIGQRGLGVDRQPCSLVRIGALGPSGDLVELEPRSAAVVPELVATQIVSEGLPYSSKAVVALVTPADLKQKGRRFDRLDGPALFRRLIRRIGTLVDNYGNPTDDARGFDYHAISVLADQVVVNDQYILNQSWERYSSRQGTKHPLSGLVGQARLTGIPEPLWPYLILGQWVHVGKGASFGQGRYVVVLQDEAGTGSLARA